MTNDVASGQRRAAPRDGGERVALVVGLSTALVAVAAGWGICTPVYSATARVALGSEGDAGRRLASVEPGQASMFLAHLDSEAAVVRSRRVLDLAQSSDSWGRLTAPGAPRENLALAGVLTTEVHANGVIDIRFEGDRAEQVAVAANVVLNAYVAAAQERAAYVARARHQALEARGRQIARRLHAIDGEERELIDAATRAASGEEPALPLRRTDLAVERSTLDASLHAVQARLEEARLRERESGLRILSYATRPTEPSRDDRPFAALAGGVVGFLLAAGGACFIQRQVD